MSSSEESLTLHQVAEELGVHYMTAYRYVRIGRLPSHRDGHRWLVRRADLAALIDAPAASSDTGGADWVERLARRLVGGDEAGAWMVIEAALVAGTSPIEILEEVLAPAMRSVGDDWAAGRLGVDEEHVASTIAVRLVARTGARFARRGVSKGSIVLGTAAGEMHALPGAIAGETLRLTGYDVTDLGADLPPDAFARAVARTPRLVAVGVSATTPGLERDLELTIGALKAVTEVPIILGGAATTPEMATALGADAWGASTADLLDQVRRFQA